MKSFYTIGLLIISNIFMTFAWYGHLKLKQESGWFASLPLIGVVIFSWSIAFFEYNNIGPGAKSRGRVAWSRQLTTEESKKYALKEVWGEEVF